jgi:hypothetical protein
MEGGLPIYTAVYLISPVRLAPGNVYRLELHVHIRSAASPPHLLSGLQVLGTKHLATVHLPVCCVTVETKVLRLKRWPLNQRYFEAQPLDVPYGMPFLKGNQ